MTRTLSVSAVQFEIEEMSSFDDFGHAATLAVESTDTQVVMFPELTTLGLASIHPGWRDEDPAISFARIPEYTDRYRSMFAELAKKRDQVIVGGSHLVSDGPGRLLNIGHVFFPDGRLLTHTKTHIFPGERAWNTFEGDTVQTFTVDGTTVGFLICYEAEVPEISTILTRAGAEVLLVPSYTFYESGFHRVRKTLAARCIENQVYAMHCSTYSVGTASLASAWAKSSALAPCDVGMPVDGVLAEAPQNVPTVLSNTFDLDLLEQVRSSGVAPTLHDRSRKQAMYADYAHFLWPTTDATV